MTDDAKTLANVHSMIDDFLGRDGFHGVVSQLEDVEDLIERLTPKKMTTQDACEVFESTKYRRRKWAWSKDNVYTLEHQIDADLHLSFTGTEAVYIAQGLLRDGNTLAGEIE